jgi:hypothetical protein
VWDNLRGRGAEEKRFQHNDCTPRNESIAVVDNAIDLLDAVRCHTRHIELQQHVDVTGMHIPSSREHILGMFLPTGIESIRVHT